MFDLMASAARLAPAIGSDAPARTRSFTRPRRPRLPAVDSSIRALFHPAPGLTYLDTATYGLPPDPTTEAMRKAHAEWVDGTGRWVDWDRQSERARVAFARLMNVAR